MKLAFRLKKNHIYLSIRCNWGDTEGGGGGGGRLISRQKRGGMCGGRERIWEVLEVLLQNS